MPADPTPAAAALSPERDTSIICRHCGTLVGGVEAGDRVRWSECTNENQQRTADGRWVCAVPLRASRAWMPRWLRALLRVPQEASRV